MATSCQSRFGNLSTKVADEGRRATTPPSPSMVASVREPVATCRYAPVTNNTVQVVLPVRPLLTQALYVQTC